MKHWPHTLLAAIAIIATASDAFAQPRATVKLELTVAPAASACPGAEALSVEVAKRLGYVPFSPTAARTLVVHIDKPADSFTATLAWRAESTTRELSAKTCDELLRAIGLAVSIAIDPLAGTAPAPKPEPPPPPPVEPPAPPPAVAAPKTHWHVGLAPQATIGLAPGVSPALAIRVGATRRNWSASVEAQANLARSETYETGDVDASTVIGSVVACHWLGALATCALVSGGAVRGQGSGFVDARTVTRAYVGAGARLAWAVARTKHLVVEGFADVRAAILRTELTVSGNEVWTLPPAAGGIGIAVLARW